MDPTIAIIFVIIAVFIALFLLVVGLLLGGKSQKAKPKKRTKSKRQEPEWLTEAPREDDSEWLSAPVEEDVWVKPRQRQGMSWAMRLMLLTVPVAIAVAGTAVFVGTVLWFFEYQSSAEWPTVQGTVTTSRIEERITRNRRGRTERVYDVHFEYRYMVNGETYYNRDVFFKHPLTGPMVSYSTSSAAQSFVSRYPPGGKVTVIYNSANPQRAIIERRIDEVFVGISVAGGIAAMIVGGGATVFGVISGLRST
ncbi:MAG: DUF3592 domain-containing protein [Anaerolineae bacterium]|nr:DUF3592 domain-containing protein [Anaerolineae bacterium]